MNDKKVTERKEYLALQAFYLRVKQLIEDLEKKHPEFVYNNSIKKEKGVNDLKEDDKKRNVISL